MSPSLTLGKSRLEALSDGVFSIAMTLLVLEIKVPDVHHQHSNADMLNQLVALGPAFFAFAVTFVISGAFWFLHHLTFHFIRHTDRLLCWINLIFLMFVSLLPFSAGMLTHLLVHPVSHFFYYGNQLTLALLLGLHWMYAIRKKMIAPDADPKELRRVSWRIGTVVAAFTGAIVMAAMDPRYSYIGLIVPIAAMRVMERVSERRRQPHN